MKLANFNWKSGKVVYWDLNDVDEARPLVDQCEHLKEDLAQVEFPNGMLLDISWLPDCDPDGEFVICVVENGDWMAPKFRAVAKDIETLQKQISIGISGMI